MSETRLDTVAWRYRYRPNNEVERPWRYVDGEGECNLQEDYERQPLTPLHPAQEALDRAEERVRELEEELETAEAVAKDATEVLNGMGARLERVRPVVRATGKAYQAITVARVSDPMNDRRLVRLQGSYDALLPEDRDWAEGEG